MRKRLLRSLTVVAVVFGTLAALVGPNLYAAMQRTKQKRTYATLRDWGIAVEAYGTTHASYPRAGYYGSVAGLKPLIAKKLPVVDGWGHPLIYHGTKNHYALRSTARDGVDDHRIDHGQSTNFDDDALYAGGGFVRVTEGICGDGSSGDDWDVKKYGECASCHPRHVRHS